MNRPDLTQAVDRLIAAGYRRLGDEDTSYGKVFRRDQELSVIKLFSRQDRAFIAFVNYATAYPNPHLPQFRSKMVNVTEEYAAVRMEYLPPLSSNRGEQLAHDLEAYLLTIVNGPPIWPWVKKVIARLQKTQPTLLETVRELTENLIVADGFYCDLKGDHLRRRGTTVVLIDPICGRGQ